jgi:hypothetical protein
MILAEKIALPFSFLFILSARLAKEFALEKYLSSANSSYV